jgi:predicted TIM-barrel fold metal-dependent hydrolase
MPHVLAKLKNVPLEIIKAILEKDKAFHASQGMYLEYLWQNADDENEVQFLFRIDNIEQTKALINKLHTDALMQDPNSNLPEMIYLK